MQLPPGVGARSARWLFSQHVLLERAPEWREFAELDVGALHSELLALWEQEHAGLSLANEGVTEDRLIRPVLRALGHSFTLFPEIPGTGKQPDYLLYPSDGEREAAERGGPQAKVDRAIAVGDAKRFDLPLDRRSPDGDPVAQIRDYILLTGRPFGILTNGRVWRLYARDAALVERACHEVDLGELLAHGSQDDLRYFTGFFGAQAFVTREDGRSFLERALDDSRLHAVAISDELETAVFGAVPRVAEGLLGDDLKTRENLDEAFENALVFLYRVLFCLFAEARGLLPVQSPEYRRFSVANQRVEISGILDGGRYLSPASTGYWDDLQALFRMIEGGEPGLGVTEYDGTLFDPREHQYFESRSVPDPLLAPALDRLYRAEGAFVDHRDLSVRSLGTVYERLLAWRLVEADDGSLALAESPLRHETGSYFTPEAVVDALVERTLDPILTRLAREASDRGDDVLDRMLAIDVLDPAMGSGHFLVGAVEYIAQAIATEPAYDGDLSLADLRRLVAERCLYGVDLNPLAVELARLSLWLVTARVGEPLSFLGNLRVGNSLVGADNETLLDRETGLLEAHLAASTGELLRQVGEIERTVTRTAADARAKRVLSDRADVLRESVGHFAHQAIERFRPPDRRPWFHWPLEFPDVFVDANGRPRVDAGFDAVIGNPPYIRIQELGRELADYCRRRFPSASGSFDAYVVFLERGLQLLAPHGRLGFIVPNKLFKLDYGRKLRERLADERLVAEVIDFGSSQVFAGATNYTCLLFLDRRGVEEFPYRRVRGRRSEVLDELAGPDRLPARRFPARELAGDPWVLVPPDEAAVIREATGNSQRLDGVTTQIFQGLITSADHVYVLEHRGERAGLVRLFSSASGREVELEPDLLHPLASGVDVDRYAFRHLDSRLLFPYVREGDAMRLVTGDELAALPRTEAYLSEHETALRDRERGAMDRDGWWAYSRVQGMALHDLPKLGVAATVRRLEVAADLDGGTYFHNVRVNGILAREGISLPTILVVMNSRLLDWVFRRGSADHANDYYAANKQFIAGLPIRVPSGPDAIELDALGRELHGCAAKIAVERGDFHRWLASTVGGSAAALMRRRELAAYNAQPVEAVLAALVRMRASLTIDPRERDARELVEREHRRSVATLMPLLTELAVRERDADERVYELYGLPAAMRALVESEYET